MLKIHQQRDEDRDLGFSAPGVNFDRRPAPVQQLIYQAPEPRRVVYRQPEIVYRQPEVAYRQPIQRVVYNRPEPQPIAYRRPEYQTVQLPAPRVVYQQQIRPISAEYQTQRFQPQAVRVQRVRDDYSGERNNYADSDARYNFAYEGKKRRKKKPVLRIIYQAINFGLHGHGSLVNNKKRSSKFRQKY